MKSEVLSCEYQQPDKELGSRGKKKMRIRSQEKLLKTHERFQRVLSLIHRDFDCRETGREPGYLGNRGSLYHHST